MPTRILIVDDHEIIRAGIRSVLEPHPRYVVVAEAGSGAQALELASLHHPDLVITDVSMPDLDGIEATRAILNVLPKTKVVALSMHESRSCLARMLKAGASGYVLKVDAAKEILNAIDTVMEGHVYLSPSMVGGFVSEILRNEDGVPRSGPIPALSPRQAEVLKLIASGKALKEMASQMNLSVKTLEKHRLQVMAKLGASSSAELVMTAIRMGLVDPWGQD